ncbi:MAG: 50S ribosomal protein L6 [Pseudomonadota bacterium]
MSRIGKLPITLPSGTTVNVSGQTVEAKGSKGALSMVLSELVTPSMDDGALVIKPRADLVEKAEKRVAENDAKGRKKITFAEALDGAARTQWGTARARAANLVEGVSNGFTKNLELVGVGYRAQMQGQGVKLSLGLSHDVVYNAPEGIKLSTPKPTEIVVEGIDKQVVGQVAAEIRKFRPPEPYKGKGIRYSDEYVRRKEGKKK